MRAALAAVQLQITGLYNRSVVACYRSKASLPPYSVCIPLYRGSSASRKKLSTHQVFLQVGWRAVIKACVWSAVIERRGLQEEMTGFLVVPSTLHRRARCHIDSG